MPARMSRAVLVAALTIGVAGCTASSTQAPVHAVITARSASGLIDSTVHVSVTGLPRDSTVTVRASAHDDHGTTWTSSARFTASASGAVDVDSADSAAGSYRGRDPMGLFDLMTPTTTGDGAPYFVAPSRGYAVTLSVVRRGRVVGSTAVERTTPDSDVVRRQYRPGTAGFYGELDEPRHPVGRRPAVLVFGGSEGGLSTVTTRLLAAHGYPALALAYFDEPGLPQSLTRIPLEYFATAVRALRAAPGVDPRHVLLAGVSRGSEAALLVAAHFPTLVDGVVAGVPSSVSNVGYPDTSGPAWTLGGRPVATPGRDDFGDPQPTDRAAIIPVEDIRGPVLTICGRDDGVWPSCPYAAAITARRSAHHVAYHDVALSYPDAGHFAGSLECCYSITADAIASSGGTVRGDQVAVRDAWAHLLAFLADQ